MGKIGEWLGRVDDESVIYRADDPDQKFAWKKAGIAWVVGGVLVLVVGALGRTFASEAVVWAVMSVASIVFIVGYVIWRRRRNERLTGSPTKWPSDR